MLISISQSDWDFLGKLPFAVLQVVIQNHAAAGHSAVVAVLLDGIFSKDVVAGKKAVAVLSNSCRRTFEKCRLPSPPIEEVFVTAQFIAKVWPHLHEKGKEELKTSLGLWFDLLPAFIAMQHLHPFVGNEFLSNLFHACASLGSGSQLSSRKPKRMPINALEDMVSASSSEQFLASDYHRWAALYFSLMSQTERSTSLDQGPVFENFSIDCLYLQLFGSSAESSNDAMIAGFLSWFPHSVQQLLGPRSLSLLLPRIAACETPWILLALCTVGSTEETLREVMDAVKAMGIRMNSGESDQMLLQLFDSQMQIASVLDKLPGNQEALMIFQMASLGYRCASFIHVAANLLSPSTSNAADRDICNQLLQFAKALGILDAMEDGTCALHWEPSDCPNFEGALRWCAGTVVLAAKCFIHSLSRTETEHLSLSELLNRCFAVPCLPLVHIAPFLADDMQLLSSLLRLRPLMPGTEVTKTAENEIVVSEIVEACSQTWDTLGANDGILGFEWLSDCISSVSFLECLTATIFAAMRAKCSQQKIRSACLVLIEAAVQMERFCSSSLQAVERCKFVSERLSAALIASYCSTPVWETSNMSMHIQQGCLQLIRDGEMGTLFDAAQKGIRIAGDALNVCQAMHNVQSTIESGEASHFNQNQSVNSSIWNLANSLDQILLGVSPDSLPDSTVALAYNSSQRGFPALRSGANRVLAKFLEYAGAHTFPNFGNQNELDSCIQLENSDELEEFDLLISQIGTERPESQKESLPQPSAVPGAQRLASLSSNIGGLLGELNEFMAKLGKAAFGIEMNGWPLLTTPPRQVVLKLATDETLEGSSSEFARLTLCSVESALQDTGSLASSAAQAITLSIVRLYAEKEGDVSAGLLALSGELNRRRLKKKSNFGNNSSVSEADKLALEIDVLWEGSEVLQRYAAATRQAWLGPPESTMSMHSVGVDSSDGKWWFPKLDHNAPVREEDWRCEWADTGGSVAIGGDDSWSEAVAKACVESSLGDSGNLSQGLDSHPVPEVLMEGPWDQEQLALLASSSLAESDPALSCVWQLSLTSEPLSDSLAQQVIGPGGSAPTQVDIALSLKTASLEQQALVLQMASNVTWAASLRFMLLEGSHLSASESDKEVLQHLALLRLPLSSQVQLMSVIVSNETNLKLKWKEISKICLSAIQQGCSPSKILQWLDVHNVVEALTEFLELALSLLANSSSGNVHTSSQCLKEVLSAVEDSNVHESIKVQTQQLIQGLLGNPEDGTSAIPDLDSQHELMLVSFLVRTECSNFQAWKRAETAFMFWLSLPPDLCTPLRRSARCAKSQLLWLLQAGHTKAASSLVEACPWCLEAGNSDCVVSLARCALQGLPQGPMSSFIHIHPMGESQLRNPVPGHSSESHIDSQSASSQTHSRASTSLDSLQSFCNNHKYPEAPSAALCAGILSIFPAKMSGIHMITLVNEYVIHLTTSPHYSDNGGVSSASSVLSQLLLTAKVHLKEFDSAGTCDMILSKLSVLVAIQAAAIPIEVSWGDLSSPSRARKLRDYLVMEDRYDLALEVCTKCGIPAEPVWVEWGINKVRIGDIDGAMEKLRYGITSDQQPRARNRQRGLPRSLTSVISSIESLPPLSPVVVSDQIKQVRSFLDQSMVGSNSLNEDAFMQALLVSAGPEQDDRRASISPAEQPRPSSRMSVASRMSAASPSPSAPVLPANSFKPPEADNKTSAWKRLKAAMSSNRHRRRQDSSMSVDGSFMSDASSSTVSRRPSWDSSSVAGAGDCVEGDRLELCESLVEKFGGTEAVLGFLVRRGRLTDAVAVWVERSLSNNDFVNGVVAPALERGCVDRVASAVKAHSSNSMMRSAASAASKFLFQKSALGPLYSMQEAIGDKLRAGHTLSKIYAQMGSDWSLEDKMEKLKTIVDRLTDGARSLSSIRAGAIRDFFGYIVSSDAVVPALSERDANSLLLMAKLQQDVLSVMRDHPDGHTLFQGKDRSCHVAQCLLHDHIDLAFRIVTALHLPQRQVFVQGAVSFAQQRPSADIIRLVDEMAATNMSPDDIDEVVLAIVIKVPDSVSEKLLRCITLPLNKVKALITLGRMDAAYNAAKAIDVKGVAPDEAMTDVLQGCETAPSVAVRAASFMAAVEAASSLGAYEDDADLVN